MRTSLLILLCLLPLHLFAQNSIGFSDSTDFRYLIDYRLPDWGYSNFSLSGGNLNLTQQWNSRDVQTEDFNGILLQDVETNSTNFTNSFSIAPNYTLFRESEDFKYNLSGTFQLGGNSSRQSTENQDLLNNNENEFSSETRGWVSTFLLRSEADYFLWKDVFVRGGADIDFRLTRNVTKREINNVSSEDTELIQRTASIRPQLGIGFGRIRNISPMIRALRMNERYKELGNSSLTGSEILATADQFTRFQGYQNRYDRPLKYFWSDLNDDINLKLDGLDPFDLFYLNDVFDENLGTRLEGYSVSINGFYSATSGLSRSEDFDTGQFNRDFEIYRAAMVQLTGDWYRNLNLDHQISFSGIADVFFPLERANSTEWQLNSAVDFSWLWTVTDRFLMNNSLFSAYTSSGDKNIEDYREYRITSGIGSTFSYFLENRIALTSSIQITNNHRYFDAGSPIGLNDISTTWRWQLLGSIRYYFNRNLY